MALDTKYRPRNFDEVLGQDATISILREFVRSGAGLRQSYLFAGPFGSGKTTLGRILARSLLCDNPVNGEACGKCASCVEILENGSSADFVEIDAATNSGKDNIRKIVEQLQYSSFSGKRRIYLFDEAHQLSRDALDALLKPMEDSLPGTEDKLLVCIFATTEPDKMRTTVVSRCAPPFMIRHASVEHIVDRLEHVCQQEGFEYDRKSLGLIAEHCECHIRDALKTVEGVSMLGGVTEQNVYTYLQLNTSLSVLKLIGSMCLKDSKHALELAEGLLLQSSPSLLYEKIADSSLRLYSASLGVSKPPSWWPEELVTELKALGNDLIRIGTLFASKPARVLSSAFLCEVAAACIHQPITTVIQASTTENKPIAKSSGSVVGRVGNPMVFQSAPSVVGGTFLDPRGVNPDHVGENGARSKRKPPRKKANGELAVKDFAEIFSRYLGELGELNARQKGSENLGDS